MVYVVDSTGKVFQFCNADGYESAPRGNWTRLKQGDTFTGAEVIDLRPTCACATLHRIKRSLASFDTRSKEWRSL